MQPLLNRRGLGIVPPPMTANPSAIGSFHTGPSSERVGDGYLRVAIDPVTALAIAAATFAIPLGWRYMKWSTLRRDERSGPATTLIAQARTGNVDSFDRLVNHTAQTKDKLRGHQNDLNWVPFYAPTFLYRFRVTRVEGEVRRAMRGIQELIEGQGGTLLNPSSEEDRVKLVWALVRFAVFYDNRVWKTRDNNFHSRIWRVACEVSQPLSEEKRAELAAKMVKIGYSRLRIQINSIREILGSNGTQLLANTLLEEIEGTRRTFRDQCDALNTLFHWSRDLDATRLTPALVRLTDRLLQAIGDRRDHSRLERLTELLSISGRMTPDLRHLTADRLSTIAGDGSWGPEVGPGGSGQRTPLQKAIKQLRRQG